MNTMLPGDHLLGKGTGVSLVMANMEDVSTTVLTRLEHSLIGLVSILRGRLASLECLRPHMAALCVGLAQSERVLQGSSQTQTHLRLGDFGHSFFVSQVSEFSSLLSLPSLCHHLLRDLSVTANVAEYYSPDARTRGPRRSRDAWAGGGWSRDRQTPRRPNRGWLVVGLPLKLTGNACPVVRHSRGAGPVGRLKVKKKSLFLGIRIALYPNKSDFS